MPTPAELDAALDRGDYWLARSVEETARALKAEAQVAIDTEQITRAGGTIEILLAHHKSAWTVIEAAIEWKKGGRRFVPLEEALIAHLAKYPSANFPSTERN